MRYEHAFDVTLSVIVHIQSHDRQRNKVTKYQILEQLCRIAQAWSPEEAEAHIEGEIDYMESHTILTPEQREARAGLISASDYFDADEETA